LFRLSATTPAPTKPFQQFDVMGHSACGRGMYPLTIALWRRTTSTANNRVLLAKEQG
jgi:hypothetical protein